MENQRWKVAGRQRLRWKLAAATVPGVSTKMLEVEVSGINRVIAHLTVATAALTGFALKGKAHPDAGAASFHSSSAHFGTPGGTLVGCSGDLTAAAAGAHWFIIDTVGLETLEIWATSGGTATLAIELGGEGV